MMQVKHIVFEDLFRDRDFQGKYLINNLLAKLNEWLKDKNVTIISMYDEGYVVDGYHNAFDGYLNIYYYENN